MLKQPPVHEDVTVADLLHEVEVSSVIDKTGKIPRHLSARGEDCPENVVFQDLNAAEPSEKRQDHAGQVAKNRVPGCGLFETAEFSEPHDHCHQPDGVQRHEGGQPGLEPDALIRARLSLDDASFQPAEERAERGADGPETQTDDEHPFRADLFKPRKIDEGANRQPARQPD